MTSRPGVIDIHSHVLYGMDDGAVNPEMSVQMLEQYAVQGVTDVFCTPHSDCRLSCYRQHFDELQQRIAQRGLPVRIHTGCEIACSPARMYRIAQALTDGTMPTLADSGFALIEFDPYDAGRDIVCCAEYLRTHTDFQVVIAHTERCKCLAADDAAVTRLLELGCYFQINAYSLTAEKDENIRGFARQLLARKAVTFLGSDAHRTDHRPPDIRSGADYVFSACNAAYALNVCGRNAARLLLGCG
ncbi:MAG: hypothetical protein IJY28_07155 [Clostridia bacterium]|nr:hypothetical protein [Clostridia bacterium]